MQQAGKIYLASMGIYIFNKKTLLRLFSENPEATDFVKEIIPKAIEDEALVTSYSFSGYCEEDRKSTRLNSSHVAISYAVFCLKKKKKKTVINMMMEECKSGY